MPDEAVRLQKYLAEAGVASRRAAEKMIEAGRVAVNGQTVTRLGTKIFPGRDAVTVDGRPVQPSPKKVYLALNKPAGYVSTAADPEGRPTVLDLVPVKERIYPVGRLDEFSEGLLLLTNDGDLAYRVTHPKHNLEKEYNVVVDGRPSAVSLQRLREGVELDGRLTAPAVVEVVEELAHSTWLRITIHEGRNRQVRRMCEAIGHPVKHLQRIRIGPVRLGTLVLGKYRRLTAAEVAGLRGQDGAGKTDSD